MNVNAYAAKAAKAALAPWSYEPGPLGPDEVEVAVTHCGICHSDVHLIDDDWGISKYPLVPGHEIVGTVVARGKAVRHLKEGMRVGIGWQCGSCMDCEYCEQGDENYCSKSRATCVGHHGGFADRVRADGRFAFALPEKLSSETAAPLLCGGITVYSPLKHYCVGKGTRCAVLGLGGLGHLGVQFAAKRGAEVTVFSTSPDKEKEARSFGAAHFVCGQKPARGAYDFILSAVTADLDWGSFVAALRPEGRLCFVGASPAPLQLPVLALIGGRKSICGSPIGSRRDIEDMLAFAARKGVCALTETVPMGEVNAAVERVRRGKARYRMVLRVS
ncbi:MAG: NAD(P)-dependent alcohol dehydrogenase [Elusimicrobiota bacterium]|jgi:uncharacterized zinc-type alcohol dehydrogenase-like protein